MRTSIRLEWSLFLLVLSACGDPVDPPIVLSDGSLSDAGSDPDGGASDADVADAGARITVDVAPTGALHVARLGHTATRLPDGRVIVVGGETLARAPLGSIEEYDPATGEFVEVASLATPRANHTATLLADGRVVVVGGGPSTGNGLPAGTGALASVEIYDPVTHEVAAGPTLALARSHHDAIALADGSILVAGGAGPGASSFAPVGEAERLGVGLAAWEPAGTLTAPRAMARIVDDGDGGALVIGGLTPFGAQATVERFDRVSGAFVDAGALAGPGRFFHAVLRSEAGEVLVVGGIASTFLASVDALRPGETAFEALPELPSARNVVALVETDAGVLALGGFFYSSTTGADPLGDVLALDPESGRFDVVGELPIGRAGHTATVLASGDVLVAGGYGVFGEVSEAWLVHAE